MCGVTSEFVREAEKALVLLETPGITGIRANTSGTNEAQPCTVLGFVLPTGQMLQIIVSLIHCGIIRFS